MREVINHPVHIFDKSGDLAPSAFIPMCKFGGVNEDSETNFDVGFPVCNSFKPVLHYDQLCYEVDLNNKFKKDEDLLRYLSKGIILTLDYNEDRQTDWIEWRTERQKSNNIFQYYKYKDYCWHRIKK